MVRIERTLNYQNSSAEIARIMDRIPTVRYDMPISEYVGHLKETYPGLASEPLLAFRGKGGAESITAVADTVIEITRQSKFTPDQIVEGVNAWMQDRQLIGLGGESEFATLVWLKVAASAGRVPSAKELLSFLASDKGSQDWQSNITAIAALENVKKYLR